MAAADLTTLCRYASCRDLVRSRCNEADLEAFGYEGVQVHSVAHVHNRTLKGRYEAAVARAQDAGATTRGPVEYLLWHEHPLMPGELDHVVEHGFRHPEEYARCAPAISTLPPGMRQTPRPVLNAGSGLQDGPARCSGADKQSDTV